MLRIRLASLAFAGGLLLTLSGCCSFCEDGRLFPRLFHGNFHLTGLLHRHRGECECTTAQMPPMLDGAHGPFLTTPGAPIPITNVPSSPPQIFKVPQAAPTPYVPAN